MVGGIRGHTSLTICVPPAADLLQVEMDYGSAGRQIFFLIFFLIDFNFPLAPAAVGEVSLG